MSIAKCSEGDILYRINSHCLVSRISDEDFRNNAQSLLEDIRGYFMGRYEVMAEFRPPQMDGCIACHENLTARIAELTAKVTKYTAVLEEIGGDRWSSYMWDSDIWHSMRDLARNALKEG